MFPPLCFIDGVNAEFSANSREFLRENLSAADYALISGGNSDNVSVQVRFRIADLLAPLF